MSAEISQENLKNNTEYSHKELLTFFNAMDEVFFSTDFLVAKITVMSDSCEKLFGYKAADFLNDYLLWLNLVHPEDRHIVSNQNELLKKGKIVNSEYRIIRKDNAVKWVEKKIVPGLNKDGILVRLDGVIRDITSKKQDEVALKRYVANLRTMFDNTDSSYILIDADLKLVSFNSLAQKYSQEHNHKKLELNNLINDYFSEERWPLIQKMIKRAADGEIVQYELSFKNEDGTAKWHNIRWLNVKNSDDENCGYILVNTDITETKNAALEREKITADLIQRNNELEQFTYIVSHNLRAPVANIIGLSDMLVEDELDAEMRQEILSRVHLSIKNIDIVIKDLNQILQSRAVNENKEKVHFATLVDAIKTSLSNTILKDRVQFKCNFDELPSIFTIRGYLYSIFYNLISNSIKYRRENVPALITIKSRMLENRTEITFTDNGRGIDLEKNGGQLYGLYKRFDITTEGKGMGLFMVKTQVEALGGSIDVKSKPGEGTEFVIRFNL